MRGPVFVPILSIILSLSVMLVSLQPRKRTAKGWVRSEIIRSKLDLDNTSERIMPSLSFSPS